jgi:hypothetical protein
VPHYDKEFCTVGWKTYSMQSLIGIMILIIVGLELMELKNDGWKKYFKDARNWLQLGYAICGIVTCTPIFLIKSDQFMYWQYQAAGVSFHFICECKCQKLRQS